MSKLKGCRELSIVQQDYTNQCAAYGAANYRMITLPKDIEKIKNRLDELMLELSAAQIQERMNGTTTSLKVVEEGQSLDGLTQ